MCPLRPVDASSLSTQWCSEATVNALPTASGVKMVHKCVQEQSQRHSVDRVGQGDISLITVLMHFWLDLPGKELDRPQNIWLVWCEPFELNKTLWRSLSNLLLYIVFIPRKWKLVSHRKRPIVAAFVWGCYSFALFILAIVAVISSHTFHICNCYELLKVAVPQNIGMKTHQSTCWWKYWRPVWATWVWWTDVPRWGSRTDQSTRLLLLLLFELKSGL